MCYQVGIFECFWYLIMLRSINLLIQKLTEKHGEQNFYVQFLGQRIYVYQTKDEVKRALAKIAEPELAWPNWNFFASHGHRYGIGNLLTSDPLWHIVHSSLQMAVDPGKFLLLMEQNKSILFKHSSFELNSVLSKFVMKTWAQYSFGSDVNMDLYSKTYYRLIAILRRNFYDSRFRGVPGIGYILASLRRWISHDELISIDHDIGKLLAKSGSPINRGYPTLVGSKSFLSKFGENLVSYGVENVEQIVLDNAFLSFLLYDFLYIFLFQTMIQLATGGRDCDKVDTLRNGFLFPYRLRYYKGSKKWVIVNLVNSGMVFSYGPRACVGQVLVGKAYDLFKEWFVDYTVSMAGLDNIEIYDVDFPLVTSRHVVQIDLPVDYLRNHLAHHDFKGVRFYNITALNENLELRNYITNSLVSAVQVYKPDIIISPEARGWIYAAIIADRLNIPLVVLRKKGKLPGITYSKSFVKKYDMEEVIEISGDSDIGGKKCVIIDDGIASGASIQVVHDLVTERGCQILSVLTAVKHTYTECKYVASPQYSVFVL